MIYFLQILMFTLQYIFHFPKKKTPKKQTKKTPHLFFLSGLETMTTLIILST